jgi:hypothetical protein
MRFTGYSFGSIRVDGVTYDHDLVIDRGKIRKRKKAASRKFRGAYGHTPLSIDEDIPWRCRRLAVGTGAFLPSLSGDPPVPARYAGDTAARLVAHSGSEPAGPPTPGPGDRWLPGRVPGGRRALTARTQTFVPLSRPAVKNSSVRIPCARDHRNSAQPGPSWWGAGSMPAFLRIRQTVDGATVMPSPASSPWMRR